MYQTQLDRALDLAQVFLRDILTKLNLKLKIKQYVIGIMRVQARFAEHNKKVKIRDQILSTAYKTAV